MMPILVIVSVAIYQEEIVNAQVHVYMSFTDGEIIREHNGLVHDGLKTTEQSDREERTTFLSNTFL
jgi:hypothetical protein